MKFAPVLDLAVRHSYYADNRCPDFSIEPSRDTARLLRNHRLVVRARPDGVRVVAPVDDLDRPFIPLDADMTFEWYLRVRNTNLALITEHGALDAHRTTRYRNLSPSSDRLVPEVHEAPEQLPAGIDATVEVRLGVTASPDRAVREYAIDLDAAMDWWSYYLLTDMPEASGEFSIVDASPNPLTFGIARDLVADPDHGDAIADRLSGQHPGYRRMRFMSDRPIAARRERRNRIELRLAGQRVAGPLPLPEPSSRSVLTTTVGGRSEERASLSHIMRYPDRPPANNGV